MIVNDNYVVESPSDQHAIDLFSDSWSSLLPVEGLKSGEIPLFNDHRIHWLVHHRGRFDGQSVLELGPLEGGHTYMLEQAGASSILAIEANTIGFLKCLVAKEVLGMKTARFQLGDFDRFLAETNRRFDFLLASGVLYHMPDPLVTLTNMTKVADEMLIWSHFYNATIEDAPALAAAFTGETRQREYEGRSLTYRLRGYGGSSHPSNFCGGVMSESVWLERDQVIAFLESHGYAVTAFGDHDGHPHGPCTSLYAKR